MNQMKRILLALLTIVLTNCNAIGGDDYEIKGKLLNTEGKSIYLERISHTEMKMIDSTVVKNGQFLLKGPIESLGFYRLRIKANTPQGEIFWFLSIDKQDRIEATLDEKNPMNFSIIGGEKQKEFQDLVKNFNAHQSEIMQLYQQYNGYSQKDPNSKEAQEIGIQINAKNDNFNKYVTGVIQTSKNLMTKYYLYSVMLQQFQNQAVPEQLTQDIRLYAEKMTKELPNSPYTKDFQAIINNLDMQKKMAEAKTKLDVGSPAPDIDLVKEDGTKVKLSSFKGKIVLMDFWASWCRPCRMENPNVVAAYNKYKDKGLVILSISQDQDLSKWKSAIGQDGLIWKTHFSDNMAGGVASSTYDVSYIPKTYLLDKSGKIAAKDLRGAALDAEIEKLIKTK
jgi:peroxiredoxin